MKLLLTTAVALALIATGARAQVQDPLAPVPQAPATAAAQLQPPPSAVQPLPQPFVPPVVAPRDWRGVFDAIRAGNWAVARAGIATLPPSSLRPLALAELYTARNSPVVSLPEIQSLLAQAPELPQAEQLARLALTRGATTAPPVMPSKRVVTFGSPPSRYRTRPVTGEPLADALRAQLDPLVNANDAVAAESIVIGQAPYLSPQARAEAWQRVAWIYYIIGQDAHARRVADLGRSPGPGEWTAAAAWISGLASWRLGDCNAASQAFRQVAATTQQRELGAGAYYWAARAEQACRRPQAVAPLLRAAAQSPESFYGLIARETLGTTTAIAPSTAVPTEAVERLPNVQRAIELAAIGERPLAEEMLRHQARIGTPADQPGLIAIAKRLSLAGAQYWLAFNAQPGARVDAADRYPTPAWQPVQGWRIGPALAFAHIIQESGFRASVVSPADAVGLMQVRPGTASDMARAAGLPYSRTSLYDPAYNLEFGQRYIERLRSSGATGGQLPKVIAAYNAGPTPVARWASIRDGGDPLLWIESLSYWETRYYVPAVLRNLWVYEGLMQRPTPSLSSLVQHRWPGFPTGLTR